MVIMYDWMVNETRSHDKCVKPYTRIRASRQCRCLGATRVRRLFFVSVNDRTPVINTTGTLDINDESTMRTRGFHEVFEKKKTILLRENGTQNTSSKRPRENHD